MQVRAVTCDLNCRSYAFALSPRQSSFDGFLKEIAFLYGVRLIHSDN